MFQLRSKNDVAKRVIASPGPRLVVAYTIFGLLLALASATPALSDDFSKARDKIDSIKPNIAYKSFCSEMPSGEDKIACRMKSFPTMGFLVCKEHDIDGTSCQDVVKSERTNLATVKKAKLKTIDFDNQILGALQCGEESSKDCYGYLVAWVADGTFINLDDTIHANGIATLANDIVKNTPASKLSATKRDLSAIAAFMAPGAGKYSRICDLQGFYLKSGGFLINDVPSVAMNDSTKPVCHGAGMPSYDETLAGIGQLVKALGK
jgi:hypothetical protein